MSKYAIRIAKTYLSNKGRDSICDVFFQAMGIKSLLLEQKFMAANGASDSYESWRSMNWDFGYCIKRGYEGRPTFRKYKKEQMHRLKALAKQLT